MVDVPQGSSGSSVSKATQVFDITNDAAVLQLLIYLRSHTTGEVQTVLRDAVLDFTIKKDIGILTSQLAVFAAHGVELRKAGVAISQSAAPEVAAVPAPASAPSTGGALGSSRPKPTFAPRSAAAPTPTLTPTPPIPTPPEPVTPPEPTVPPTPPKQTAVESDTATPPAVPSVSPTPEPAAAPVPPESSTSSAPTPTTTPAAAPTDQLTRIQEIKREVNKLVGNPVNLIDVNNELGREYMNALLLAMKLVNGGAPEELSMAMDRLEKAFTAVKTSISSGETVIAAATPTPPPPTKAPAPAPTPPIPAPSEPTSPAEPAAVPQPSRVEDVVPIEATPTPAAPAPEVAPEPTEPEPAASPASVTPPKADPTLTAAKSVADQLAEETAKREALTAERASEHAAVENTDPLHSTEVTAGLQQLLSEWKIFKGGGIFGTGPSGMDSQLFKTLAPLPMAAVIANRFEGATPEVKQSITDYMNGWRYEQGVVHEMNETFEQYLRRVIRAILDRKKGPIEA